MNTIALKSGDYDGTYKLISGGEISLDFINTVSWPGTAKEHDWLDRPENVTTWALATGTIDEQIQGDLNTQPKTLLREELNHVHDIRSSLASVLRPLAHDEPPTDSAVETFNKLIRKVSRHRYIDFDNYHWVWDDPQTLTEVFNPVIWNAAHVLTNIDHTRIGHCPSCNWIFYDTTRNRSRKWCDMEDCGSRHKALRYYHRSKSTDDSGIEE